VALLVVAGVAAGVLGTAGGITSLISYPALLAVGVAPLPASFTNIVALVVCWPGSALASRPGLKGRSAWLLRWSLITAAGGAIGAWLLLSTPAGVFVRVVPFLVVAASLTLLAQPRLSAVHGERVERRSGAMLTGGLFVVSLYNGYFGAGAGVMTLALMLLAVDQHLARANALKNMLVGVATLASAAAFVLFAHIDWSAAAPLAAGMFAGSTLGPGLARRLPENVLRRLVVLVGIALAVVLWFDPQL
jgi:uncharacterized protein